MTVSTTNFAGNLSSTDDSVQDALETLDDLSTGGEASLSDSNPRSATTGANSPGTSVEASRSDHHHQAAGGDPQPKLA